METNFSKQLQNMLKFSGMTQEEFSNFFGIPKRTLQDWIYEKHIPPEYVQNMLISFYAYRQARTENS